MRSRAPSWATTQVSLLQSIKLQSKSNTTSVARAMGGGQGRGARPTQQGRRGTTTEGKQNTTSERKGAATSQASALPLPLALPLALPPLLSLSLSLAPLLLHAIPFRPPPCHSPVFRLPVFVLRLLPYNPLSLDLYKPNEFVGSHRVLYARKSKLLIQNYRPK